MCRNGIRHVSERCSACVGTVFGMCRNGIAYVSRRYQRRALARCLRCVPLGRFSTFTRSPWTS